MKPKSPQSSGASGGDFFITPRNYGDILRPLSDLKSDFGKTLDVGCNRAWLSQFVENYYGIDSSQTAIEEAKKLLIEKRDWQSSRAQECLKVATEKHLPFPDDSFDTVFMRDILEHVDHPVQLFKEATRVLKPGGHLFVSCPDNQPHVWNEPTHKRPYPIHAQEFLGVIHNLKLVYKGYESVAAGTQKIAALFGNKTPSLVRFFWRLWFWPRNAITIHVKR